MNKSTHHHIRVRRVAAAAAALAFTVAACGSDSGESEPTDPRLPPDAQAIVDTAAVAMGDVTSVRFELSRSGAPVYIDQFDAISIERAVGEFAVPRSAQAVLNVQVDGSLNTDLAAIALDDEVWLSNPITGQFETLPSGYDIDPSLFFDPENGWQPLMENLVDIELVSPEPVDRDGRDRYHLTATAPAANIEIITARLVRGQDVDFEFWVQPVTGRVRAAEFTADFNGDDVTWVLELSDYGADFDIAPPDGVTS